MLKKSIFGVVFVISLLLTVCVYGASDTYFYGFDDNKLDENVTLNKFEAEPIFENGILKSDLSSELDRKMYIYQSFSADEVNQLHIRMRHEFQPNPNMRPIIQVFFSVDNGDGTSTELGSDYQIKKYIELSSDGKFVTYIVDLTDNENYKGNIKYVRLDPINCPGLLEIDYVMLTKADKDILCWNYDSDSDNQDWTFDKNAAGYITVEDGKLKYSCYPKDASKAFNITLSYTKGFNTMGYDSLEVLMRHDITVDADAGSALKTFKVYFEGTAKNGDTVTEVSLVESNRKRIFFSADTSGDSFLRYVIPLSGELDSGINIDNMDVSKLRIDPINTYGSFEIESIRLIPKDVIYEPLDETDMKLVYEFDNTDEGCAKGKIRLDFAEQNPLLAQKVVLCYADGNSTDGFKALEDFKPIKTTDGTLLSEGYVISKDMIIPHEATAVIAYVTDSEKTFTLFYEIPEEKRLKPAEKLYTIALSSDYHFGTGAGTEYTDRHIGAYEAFKTHKPDVITVVGDITNWYGAYSKAAMDTLNDDDPDNDNPTAGYSQWELAFNYFSNYFNSDELKIPVYLVEGNHDTPEGDYSMEKKKGVSPHHMKKLLERWINYSVKEGLYHDAIEREKILYEGEYEYATFYDDYVTDNAGNKYHFIFIRVPHMGSYVLPKEELDFLDKKLFENENSGIPSFVFIHSPYKDTVSYKEFLYAKSFKDENFKAIIDRHPTAILISGHTHYTLDSDYPHTVNGKMESASYIHNGSVVGAYIGDTKDSSVSTEGNISYADIYDDRIIIRGYDILAKKWIPQAFAQITKKESADVGDISVSMAKNGDKFVLTANAEGDELTYEWYLDGVKQTSENAVIVDRAFDGYLAVRVTDKKGLIKSASFDSILDGNIEYNGNSNVIGVEGVDENSKITSDTIKLHVNLQTEENAVLVAQYNESGILIKLECPKFYKAGLNKISFDLADGAKSVSVMMWESLKSLKPVTTAECFYKVGEN